MENSLIVPTKDLPNVKIEFVIYCTTWNVMFLLSSDVHVQPGEVKQEVPPPMAALEESKPHVCEHFLDPPTEHQEEDVTLHHRAEEPEPTVPSLEGMKVETIPHDQQEMAASLPEQQEPEPSTESLPGETQEEQLQGEATQEPVQPEQQENLEQEQLEPSRENVGQPMTTSELGTEETEEVPAEFVRQPVAPAVEGSVETAEDAPPEMHEAEETEPQTTINEVSGQEVWLLNFLQCHNALVCAFSINPSLLSSKSTFSQPSKEKMHK